MNRTITASDWRRLGAVSLAVSVGLSPRQTLTGWSDLAAALEAEGAAQLWLIDSHLAMKDVYAGLLLAAQRTSRMRLGTGVTNPLTRHPTVTAGAIAAVAELSEGRAVLGLGAGDSAVYGVGWRPARVAQVEAALRFFRAVLAGEEGTWEGRAYRLPYPVPGPVPVWLAASQRRMCTLAGRLADGVILMGPASEPLVRRQVGWVEDGLREAGRARAEIEIRLVTTASARPDRAAAIEDLRSWASTQARLLSHFAEPPPGLERFADEIARARDAYDFADHLSAHAGHRAAVSDELVEALALAGTAEECAARLAGLLRCGIDGCVFPLVGAGRLERLRVMRDQVLPAALAAT